MRRFYSFIFSVLLICSIYNKSSAKIINDDNIYGKRLSTISLPAEANSLTSDVVATVKVPWFTNKFSRITRIKLKGGISLADNHKNIFEKHYLHLGHNLDYQLKTRDFLGLKKPHRYHLNGVFEFNSQFVEYSKWLLSHS